jgi:predicted branched-subunit amino acid permease
VLAALLYLAVSKRVYSDTVPYRWLWHAFGEDDANTISVLLRKIYSIVAFTIVGFLVDQALPHTRTRGLRAALVVAAFSAVIEVVQKLHHAHEGLLSNAIDVACGALGGWLGVVLARATGAAVLATRRRGTSRR